MAKKTKSAKKAAKAAKKAAKNAEKSQDLHGQAVDSASRTAGSFERALRNTIEKQPYTAVAIALGLAWLFGRMHRPF
jgi:ElaB/YqjD/DUF883 family membrane-anchored ribosome-binding protein